MRPHIFASVLPFETALAQVLSAATPIARIERVEISAAIGRVSALDVTSPMDIPPFERAAMDGYALRADDVALATPETPVTLVCVDEISTGRASTRVIAPGECAAIGTGAPIPAGADAVVMVERTSRANDRVAVREATRPRQNVGRQGADIQTGQLAIRRGDVLSPARAGALAAIGETHVSVYARPRVAMFATGNEVVPGGGPLPEAHVYDVNSTTLDAVVQQHGGESVRMPPVGDSIDALTSALQRAAACDLIVTSGGSSVGVRDLLIDALKPCGSVVFHGIAVKPGKPTLFGHVGATPLFGMPGNPTSCLSNAHILLVPYLRTVARLPLWQPVRRTLPLTRAIAGLADRHQFYTVRIVEEGAEPAFKSSGDITSMAAADGYIEIPAGSEGVEAGAMVTVVLF